MQENTAKTAGEWVFVARTLAQLPEGQNQALRCLARAELLAESVSDWLAVAAAWNQDFNDPEMARQCMSKAEAPAKDEDSDESWMQIADMYLEMGDYPQAIEIYRESVELRSWRHLAELRNIYGKNSDGTTPLDWVEPGMTGRASRDLVWEAEEYLSDNYAMAIRLLLEAESLAEGSRDWVRIAGKWREGFPNSDSAKQCMERAEEVVDVAYDWVLIATAWKDGFQDSDNAIRCLEEAEDHANKSSDSWTKILEIWKDDFQDIDNYLRCVEKCANDLEDPWDCLETALYDDFAYNQFIQRQGVFIDLGPLTEYAQTCIGIWGSDCASERRPGSYARYYGFTLLEAEKVSIYLESKYTETYLYLVSGDSPNGEVLDEGEVQHYDDSFLSGVGRTLSPGAYTVEATTFQEKETEIFTLKIYVDSYFG